MQKQLYLEDQYLKEAKSKVLKIDGNKIWLEDNLFSPKTKGEPSDLGTVNDIKVTGVEKEDQEVVVILEKEVNINEGEDVSQVIDWDFRYDAMKKHSALHFLTGVIEKEHSMRAVAGNIYPDKAVLTYKQVVPEMILFAAEEQVNELIERGLEIKTYWDEKREGFRWCKIGDFDPIPCGGMHVKNINEIEKIIIEGKGDKIEIKLEK